MMKNKFRIILITSIFLVITFCSGIIIYADDNSDFYNNYIYPKAVYKQGVTPAFSVNNIQKESIDPATGTLEVKYTDIFLKGTNGLDLSLTRYYNSLESNVSEVKARLTNGEMYRFLITFYSYDQYENGLTVYYVYNQQSYAEYLSLSEAQKERDYYKNPDGSYLYVIKSEPIIDSIGTYIHYQVLDVGSINTGMSSFYYDSMSDKTYADKYFNIGKGWTFDLPFIETRDSYKYLHYGSSGTFRFIEGYYPYFPDNPYNDIKIEKDDAESYSNGQTVSKYIVTEKTGLKTYFAGDGRLLKIVDKFENEIKFTHTPVVNYENGVVSILYYIKKIVDTVGREIVFNYSDNQVTITVADKTNSQNNRTITYNKSNNKTLDSVVDSMGREIKYIYDMVDFKESFTVKEESRGLDNQYAYLKKIIYPTGGETYFNYSMSTKNCGNEGYMNFIKAIERYDLKKNDVTKYAYKKYNYKYENTPEFDGYPLWEGTIKSENPVKTMVEDLIGNKNIFTFLYQGNQSSSRNLLYKNIKTFENNIFKKEIISEYDQYLKFPILTINRMYNEAQFIEQVQNFEYDNWKNLIGSWNNLATRDSSFIPLNDEHKTTYTYDATYNLVKSKTYKTNVDTTINEKYDLTDNSKNVNFYSIYRNNILQKKNQYGYDDFGNIESEKEYTDATHYIETLFDYTDNNYDTNRNFTGTFLTKKTVLNVQDADGNLKNAEEFYKYDWFGNVIEKEDANGNITWFEYDKLNRVTKQTNDDESFKTLSYVTDLTENSVTSCDENFNSTGNGIKAKTVYDEFGNTMLQQVFEKNITTGALEIKDLTKYSYDTYFRLNKEENLVNNSNICYTLDNDGRLLKKESLNSEGSLLASEIYDYIDAMVDNGKTYAIISKTIKGSAESPDIVTKSFIANTGKIEKIVKIHDGVPLSNTFEYDYIGNKIKEKTAHANAENLGYTAQYEYNYAGKVVKTTNIEGRFSTNQYDSLGRLVTSTDFAGNTSNFKYDELDHLIKEQTPFESDYMSTKSYYYDLVGNVVLEKISSNKSGETEKFNQTGYEYDNMNRLTKVITYNNGIAENFTQYFYDLVGNKLRMYTGLNKPLEIYDLDNIAHTGDENYSTSKYEYNQFGKLVRFTDPLGIEEIYEYELNGNLTKKVDRNDNYSIFVYDGLGRLTSEIEKLNGILSSQVVYTFDDYNNRKSMMNNDVMTDYEYDKNNRLIYDKNNRLINEVKVNNEITETTKYFYDNNGNQIYKGTDIIAPDDGSDASIGMSVVGTNTESSSVYNEYDGLNQLISTAVHDKVVLYSYDSDGLRASKSVNGSKTDYIWDGQNIVSEINNGTLTNKYIRGINLIYGDLNGVKNWYLFNGHGDVVGLSDVNGNVLKLYDYDAFGNLCQEQNYKVLANILEDDFSTGLEK